MCISRDNLSHQVNRENQRQTYIIGLKQLGHSKEGFGGFHDTKVLPLVVWKRRKEIPIITASFGPDAHVCIDVYFLSLTWFMRYKILVRIWAHFRGFMGVSLNTRAWKQSTDKDWHWPPCKHCPACPSYTLWVRHGKTHNDFGSDFPLIPVKHGHLQTAGFAVWDYKSKSNRGLKAKFSSHFHPHWSALCAS